jgi:hypothetical protein
MHRDFRDTLTTRQRSALVAYLSFALIAPAVRGLAAAVRSGRFPERDVTVRGVHVHHYVPGIALLALAGGLGMRDSSRIGVHCLVGGTYGTGAALVADELPMLIDFRDVYWTPEGRWAVDLALSIVAAGGAYFAGQPLWRGLAAELASARAGGGPDRG